MQANLHVERRNPQPHRLPEWPELWAVLEKHDVHYYACDRQFGYRLVRGEPVDVEVYSLNVCRLREARIVEHEEPGLFEQPPYELL